MTPDNHFLRSLAPDDRDWLAPSMTRLTMERGAEIADVGRKLESAWFPLGSILSVITVMGDGRMMESRTIGRESGYGLLHALGSRHATERVEVQVGGEFIRIPLDALAALVARNGGTVRQIVQHAQATLVQSAFTVACNAMHAVEPRLCRWLLLTQDRLQSDVLPLTQEHLGIMLGVQRTTVTAAIGALQSRREVSTRRGRITVLNRGALEACACECYGAIERTVGEVLDDNGVVSPPPRDAPRRRAP